MYQRYSASKIKNRKKSFIFCCNIFRISIALCIPILYKIYISEYIKSNFHVSFQIKFLENYIPYLKDVYSSLFNKYKLQIVIPLLMIYNYCNIYKTFILLISLQYPLILSQILNIYLINRINNKAEINNELIYTTGYTLILWEILFNSDTDEKIHYSIKSIDSIRKGPNINKFSLFLITIFISILHFINFILFNNIENILFDLIIGLTLYYIFFKIFELDPNNPRQFQNFVDFSLFYFILISFMINLFFIIFTINATNNYPNKEEIIQNIIYKYSFSSIIIGIFFGAKYEYNFYFEKRFGNWAQYNFEFDGEIAEEDESLASSISFNKARQWNHTNFCISLIRLFFIFLLSFTCLYPFLNITSDNFYQNLILNNMVPWNILGFGLFHLFKLVLKYFNFKYLLLIYT